MEFKKMKALKKEKQITLVQLGRETGYSASFLSQIERGINRPSLVALRKIAQALEVPVIALLANEEAVSQSDADTFEAGYRIVRCSNKNVYNPWQKNSTCYDTLFNLPVHTNNFVVSKIYIDAHSSSSGQQIAHNLREINYIVKGQATIELASQTFLLNEGDTIYLESFKQHNVLNCTNDELLLFTLQF